MSLPATHRRSKLPMQLRRSGTGDDPRIITAVSSGVMDARHNIPDQRWFLGARERG
jgi:hypothetical protein